MSPSPHCRPVLTSIGATIAGLVLAAALTPDQSPILPIELIVVLVALGTWAALRPHRPAMVTLSVFGALLTVLTIHILTGDLSASKGARELVPDVVVLASALAVTGTAGRAAFRRTTRATA
jgi:hypothetical protein